MRMGLTESHERAWAAIAAPGTWLTGAQRVAVAAEIRHARNCPQCARLKAALSPEIPGEHHTLGALDAAEIALIHRVVSDPGRLTEAWTQSVLAKGLTEAEYVEIVGIVAMVMMIDTFHRALGQPEQSLPAPQPGEPTCYTPPGAKQQAAWLPLVEPEDAVPADGPLYPHPRVGYIYRALSLVPQAVRDYWALACEHYLPSEVIYKFGESIRAITRPQTELLAARVSALHQCAY